MISRTAQLRALPNYELLAFTRELSTLDWQQLTQADFDKIDRFIESDGCTGVPDFYRNGCVIHDWWYRTHRNLDATPISEKQADVGLKEYIISRSPLGRFSLISWWYYRGVRMFGKKAWRG